MRLQQRDLTGQTLVEAISTFEIIESYPTDKYLPSFLIRGEAGRLVFHAQIATDVEGDNVRVVTMYVPNSEEWHNGGRERRDAE
jgi:hypothetical protein